MVSKIPIHPQFCDLWQATRYGIIFGIDIQKRFTLSYAWDKEKNCYIQRDGKFLTYTRNCEQKATIGTVKLSLKIPPQHNGFVPIKITGPVIKEHMAYFITDDNSTKGRDLNINIINGIHKIKGKYLSAYWYLIIPINTSLLQSRVHRTPWTCLMDDMTIDQPETHPAHSVTLQKMMAEQVQPDIFYPPCHKLKPDIQSKLDALLKQYETQFAKDETSIRTTPLTEMTINTGSTDPISQKPYPITVKNY